MLAKGNVLTEKPEVRLKRMLEGSALAPLALAESCTGGLIAARVTSVAGSSGYFDRGFVVYSNRAKVQLLGVPVKLLETHGAVSRETALAMLDGLFANSPAGIGAAVTGIAGPDGGTAEKPVGTVWIAWGTRNRRHAELLTLSGDRDAIREEAATAVLERLCGVASE